MKKIKDGYVFYDEDLLKNKRGHIDWEKSIGLTLRIMYDYEIYVLKIVGKDDEYIYLEYNNNIDKLLTMNIRKCAIGKIIGKVTREFKYNISDVFKDSKRDFVIIDKRYKQRKHANNNNSIINEKQYKYKCNKCNNEDWFTEYDLERGCNCNVCCGRKALLGFNTIWDTDRWMCSLGLSEEDAKTHTKGSNDKVVVVCPNCNKKKEIKICNIYTHKSIGCPCSDKRSYPEKFMMSVLDQLGIEYETQYSPPYLTRLENGKVSKKYSDFYLPQYGLIIETDGGMNHEGGKVHGKSKKPLEYYIEVDNWKDEQHLLHGLKTIRINCFESNMEYIKNSILNSELNKIFDLSKVDWIKCENFAIKTNLVKEVCLRWNSKEEWETTRHLAEYFGLSKNTIIRYLKRGTELGWCNYNPKEKMRKSG